MITGRDDEPGDLAPARQESVARLLDELRHGRRQALDELFPLVYEELRELAHRQRRAWGGQDTLNTTALVHEAYLKLVGQGRATWETEAHFLATAARAIRHILINYARDRRAQKRGGDWQQVSLNESGHGASSPDAQPWEERVVAVDEALERLTSLSERQGRIVECRFFAGMTVRQTAAALGLSTASVTRGWTMARAWLHRELGGEFGTGQA